MAEKTKLMIVDDSSIIRQVISKYLNSFNIEIVGTASNGVEALEVFKKTSPDIITLDITMPELDGLSVLEEIIKIDSNIKVMVVTALNDKTTGLRAIKLGAKSFVGKPFTEDKLKEAFAKLVIKN
ncbi:MAG: response regulator [Calditrichia bacterium]|nr:response regulator [Calditrichia bacterium]